MYEAFSYQGRVFSLSGFLLLIVAAHSGFDFYAGKIRNPGLYVQPIKTDHCIN